MQICRPGWPSAADYRARWSAGAPSPARLPSTRGFHRPGPQAYSDDRFYFVHDGQLYEITILHTGKEDWTVYDRFRDSFHF